MHSTLGGNTLISANIRKLYFCEEATTNKENEEVRQCFDANDAYKFEKITELYPPAEATELQDYDYYLQCCLKLSPLFWATHNLYKQQLADFEEQCWHVDWLGSNFAYYQRFEDTSTVERILFLTALMEHALGNVFYTKTSGRTQPPHLLKDLLSSAELCEVFGADAIAFLRVIMGTPKSLNLRNIVWHGFPQPHEIPEHFVAVLLCTCHSLGCILADLPQFHLQQRKQIANFDSHLGKFNADEFTIACDYVDIVNECKWLSGGHKLYWHQQLFKYYEREAYWQFVQLVLPQIELLLRLIYAEANTYDVSAKLDEYYITMDTIFECDVPVLPSRKNKLLTISQAQTEPPAICIGAMKCLYDMFAAPGGLRLRDKVSHGEVHMSAINNALLCRILLYLSLHLLSAVETSFPLANYDSRFHLNSLCMGALNDASSQLQQFCQKYGELKGVCISACAPISISIQIFQRPRKEAEIMELLRKIAKCHMQTITNYEEGLGVFLAQLSQRELHSRRRRTLEKQMATLPVVCETVVSILQCINIIFLKFQNDAEVICTNAKSIDILVRFLKSTLQISENLVKYAHMEHNEWLKALESCNKFATQRERLFTLIVEIGE